MKNLLLIALLALTLFSCKNDPSKQSAAGHQNPATPARTKTNTPAAVINTPKMDGVLMICTDSMRNDFNAQLVLNPDKSAFAKIAAVNGIEPYSTQLKGNILAYYPDFYVIHFEAGLINDSVYSVKVGEEFKIVAQSKYTAYLSWPEYLRKFYCTASLSNPLRRTASEDGEAMMPPNYKALNFNCIEVKGEWVKVTANALCQGCPMAKTITGWLRWRKNGKVILNQLYSC